MDFPIRDAQPEDADAISTLVQAAFDAHVADDWEAEGVQTFRTETRPERLRERLRSATYGAIAESDSGLIGVVLFTRPSWLALMFVHPACARRGVGRGLWEAARAYLRASHPDVHTVELNASPYAVAFYRALGFAPISREFLLGGSRATRMACWLRARELGAELEVAGEGAAAAGASGATTQREEREPMFHKAEDAT